MIEDAQVWFTNGNAVDAERVKFKESGWVAVRVSDGWMYYPPRHIARVMSRDGDADD